MTVFKKFYFSKVFILANKMGLRGQAEGWKAS